MTPLNEVQRARLTEWLEQFFHSEGDTWDHDDWFDFDACVSALAPALELPEDHLHLAGEDLVTLVRADWSAHSAAVKAIVGEPE